MKLKFIVLNLLAAQICFAGTKRAEWEIKFDAQASPSGLCKNLDKLLVWGGNLQLLNTLNPAGNTSNVLYVGIEPVGDYYSPRRELAGAIRYGGSRGDRVWLMPSRSNSNYIEAVLLDARFGPFHDYCVFIPLKPIPSEMFE